jgi:hypothetical protein
MIYDVLQEITIIAASTFEVLLTLIVADVENMVRRIVFSPSSDNVNGRPWKTISWGAICIRY